ncbi:MAG TPA: hypothetical protein VFM70_11935 [Salinimicrobium sp.]|nr:hypothetical protein [Salinimicrobium sp.]
MEKRIKLIWDFRGADAEMTAKHHAVHLKEFNEKEKLQEKMFGYEKINDSHSIAYMVVKQSEMIAVRDALKPQRGTFYNDENP